MSFYKKGFVRLCAREKRTALKEARGPHVCVEGSCGCLIFEALAPAGSNTLMQKMGEPM